MKSTLRSSKRAGQYPQPAAKNTLTEICDPSGLRISEGTTAGANGIIAAEIISAGPTGGREKPRQDSSEPYSNGVQLISLTGSLRKINPEEYYMENNNNKIAINTSKQQTQPCFSDGEKPPETTIRNVIREEYDGGVVTTASGNKLHVPSGDGDGKSICHISEKSKNPRDKKLEHFPQGTKDFCNPCLERLFPERSNRHTDD